MTKDLEYYRKRLNKWQDELDRLEEFENETGRFEEIFRHARKACARGKASERDALRKTRLEHRNTIRKVIGG